MSRPASSRAHAPVESLDAARALRDRELEEYAAGVVAFWGMVPDRLETRLFASEHTRTVVAAALSLKADGIERFGQPEIGHRLREWDHLGPGRKVSEAWFYVELGSELKNGGVRPSPEAFDRLTLDRLADLAQQREIAALLADIGRRQSRGEVTTLADVQAAVEQASATADTVEETWAEPAAALLARARVDTRPLMLVAGLVVRAAITLIHGDPRGFKSWLAMMLALCAAAGVPVFGRCDVPTPLRVLYVTGEDSQKRIQERLDAMIAGLGLPGVPPTLFLSVQAGVWLDDAKWRQRVLTYVRRQQIDLVIIDPLRQASGAVDKGPSDLQPLARWLRELITLTGVSLVLVHHDSKPLVGAKDERRLPHRASGGGIFSIADAPIHVERLGETMTTRVTPRAWKFAADPPPLDVTLDVVGDPMTVATLTAAEADETTTPGLEHAVLSYLEATPNATGTAIAKGIRARKSDVLAALPVLASAGKVDSIKLTNRTEWFLTREVNA